MGLPAVRVTARAPGSRFHAKIAKTCGPRMTPGPSERAALRKIFTFHSAGLPVRKPCNQNTMDLAIAPNDQTARREPLRVVDRGSVIVGILPRRLPVNRNPLALA